MRSSSFARHGRSRDKADAAMLEVEAVAAQAALVAANRERLRMDAPTVDPKLLRGAQAVFVRGQGWFTVERVNEKSIVARNRFGLARFLPNQIVDYR